MGGRGALTRRGEILSRTIATEVEERLFRNFVRRDLVDDAVHLRAKGR